MVFAEAHGGRCSGMVVASGGGDTEAQAARAVAGDLKKNLRAQLLRRKPAFDRPPADALAGLLVFVSSQYEASGFAAELSALLPGVAIYGCTTSGELTPQGWSEGKIVAVGFLRADFTMVAHVIHDLAQFSVEEGRRVCDEALGRLMAAAPQAAARQMFGILLIDGLCRREEAVISALYTALDDIPIVGGSAGDGLNFEKTWMIRDGSAFNDAAILLLLHTRLPFQLFKCDYFEPTSQKMVVTEADTEARIVRELNAEPAAREYARNVGVVESGLDAFSFASHPVLVGVGGQYYARSIAKVNPDGSLSFFCAIDEGLVLTVAKLLDPFESTQATFDRMEAELGEVSLYLGFDCVLRRLSAERQQLAPLLSELYARNRVVGFNTYGEQYCSMHVNQTFTGIAFGFYDAAELAAK